MATQSNPRLPAASVDPMPPVPPMAAVGEHGRDSPPRQLFPRNPATGAVLAPITCTEQEQLEAVLQRAGHAQRQWAALSFRERRRQLLRLRAAFAGAADEIADAICAGCGKTRFDALSEVFFVCDALGYFAKRAPRMLRDRRVRLRYLKHKRCYQTYYPRGVVAVISPWNYPLTLSMGPAILALAAGNAVVLKPSEHTPWVGALISQACVAAQLPPHLLQVVQGDGALGAALVAQPLVNKVAFVGSVATGKRIAEVCARNLTPVTLELGGKDPMIVLPDANVERAANGAVWGAFLNAGQVCTSVERVYVARQVAQPFIDLVVAKTESLRTGPPTADVDVGSMTVAAQLEVVEAQLADAVRRGARILTGGRRSGVGLCFEPTVLTDVTHEMAIMRDETFGPVLPIMVVDSAEEALQLANDSHYGLSSSVWGGRRQTFAVAKQIEAGSVDIDDVMIHGAMLEAPLCGNKWSGSGVLYGAEGLRSFCNARVITTSRFRPKTELNWFPYGDRMARIMSRFLRLFWGRRRP